MSTLSLEGTSQSVLISFSPRAATPAPGQITVPLPNTPAFDSVRGRAGDLIVIQLASANGVGQVRRSALRTLNLKGPRSAALHMSTTPTVWGNISAVRDLVAVVELSRVEYTKSAQVAHGETAIDHETKEYGSGTRPGQLWRGVDGVYFGYESDRHSLRTYWSTKIDFPTFLLSLTAAELPPDPQLPDSYMAIDHDGSIEHQDGSFSELSELLGDRAITGAVLQIEAGLEVFWRKPYRRFHDRDTVRGEIGVISAPADPAASRRLAASAGDLEKIRRLGGLVRYRTNGISREVDI